MSLSGTTIARYSGRDRRLEPSRTAILVVDAQNAEVSEEVRDTYPDFYRNVHETALPAMRRLLDGARKRNAEVIYTVIESMTQDGRDPVAGSQAVKHAYPQRVRACEGHSRGCPAR